MKHLVCFFIVCLLFSSCIPNKSLVYLQPGPSLDSTSYATAPAQDYVLRAEDVLVVDIASLDPKVSDLFTGISQTVNNAARAGNPASLYLEGYTIEKDGHIALPVVGKVNVAGLTLSQATDVIQTEIDKFFINATAKVKMVSFRVTVLGEVRRPGLVYFYNDELTILEALGLAGDLTEFGNRTNITVIRKTDEGSDVHTLDLSSREILQSPYFYLAPGDVVYVEPMKAGTQRFNLPAVSIILSSITTVFVIVQVFRQ